MDKVDDATITAQVSAGLAKDPDLSAVKINVDTRNGAVTLNGPAPNLAAKDRAQTIAKSIKGVTSVTNLLVHFCAVKDSHGSVQVALTCTHESTSPCIRHLHPPHPPRLHAPR